MLRNGLDGLLRRGKRDLSEVLIRTSVESDDADVAGYTQPRIGDRAHGCRSLPIRADHQALWGSSA